MSMLDQFRCMLGLYLMAFVGFMIGQVEAMLCLSLSKLGLCCVSVGPIQIYVGSVPHGGVGWVYDWPS